MAESFSVKAILSAADKGFTSTMNRANKTASSLSSSIKNTALGIAAYKAVGVAVSSITSHMDSAITRFDTMNQFPKVMSNLGISVKNSDKAVKTLSDKLAGLPTALDAGTRGVTRFTSKNGDIKKSTNYFLALNNAIIAGGASTDLQNSAIEQLSQSYSKGKMDMMEWRSLQMAMPGQLNQVAKAMGITSDVLGEGLRSGTISMDSFMDTIVKLNSEGVDGFASFEEQARSSTGGIKTNIQNLNTAMNRGMAGCLNSIDEMLAKNNLPAVGEMISNVSTTINDSFTSVQTKIKSVDLAGILATAEPYWNSFKDTVTIVADACGEAFGSIASSIGDFLSQQSTIDTITTIIKGVGDAISFLASVVSDNSDIIVGAIPYIFAFGIAFKGVKTAVSVANKVQGFIDKVKGLPGVMKPITKPLSDMPSGLDNVGKSCSTSATQILASGAAFLMLGAGVALASLGLALLTQSAVQLASAGPLAIVVMVGLVAALAGLAYGASIIAPALTAGAVGFIAFGAAVALVGVGALLAATALMLVAGVLPVLVEYGLSGAVSIAALGASMLVFGAGALVAGAASLVLGAGLILVGVGALGAAVGVLALAVATIALGAGLNLCAVGAVVLGPALLTLSVGALASSVSLLALTAAVIAFTAGGVASLAGTVALTAGFVAFGASLIVVTAGMVALAAGLLGVLGSMKAISSSAKSTEKSLKAMKSSVSFVNSALEGLGSLAKSALKSFFNAFSNAEGKAKSAGQNVGNNISAGVKSGMTKLPLTVSASLMQATAVMALAQTQAYSAGVYIGQGLGNGMSSQLGYVRNVAAQLAAAAEKAIRAKAQIHSPSKVSDKLGAYFGQGFGNGILDMATYVNRAAENLFSIPKAYSPKLTFGGFNGSLSEEYSYYQNAEFTINIPFDVDGREFAHATGHYTQEELEEMEKFQNYLKGVR